MEKGLLPILARLHTLQGVSRLAPDGGRIVASRNDPTPITVVLREINETLLGRVLHFSSDSGTALSLEVSGRRVLRILRAEGLPEAEDCLATPALEYEDKDALIRVLQAFAVPGREIRVACAPMELSSKGISVGLPVALIADLLQVDLNGLDAEIDVAPPPPSPVAPSQGVAPQLADLPHASASIETGRAARFARENGSVLMAWLILGGPEDGTSDGPEEMVDHLRDFLTEERDALASQLDRFTDKPGDPVAIALGANLSLGHSVLCARFADGVILGLGEGDLTQTLGAAWAHMAF